MPARATIRRTLRITATAAVLVGLAGCFPLNYVAWGVASEMDRNAREAHRAKIEKLPDIYVAFHLDDGSTVMGRIEKQGRFETLHKALDGHKTRIVDGHPSMRSLGGVVSWRFTYKNDEGATVPLQLYAYSERDGTVSGVQVAKPLDVSKVCLTMRPTAEKRDPPLFTCEQPLESKVEVPARSVAPQASRTTQAPSVRKSRCWGYACNQLPLPRSEAAR